MRYAYDIFSIPILCLVAHVDGTTEARLRIIFYNITSRTILCLYLNTPTQSWFRKIGDSWL